MASTANVHSMLLYSGNYNMHRSDNRASIELWLDQHKKLNWIELKCHFFNV